MGKYLFLLFQKLRTRHEVQDFEVLPELPPSSNTKSLRTIARTHSGSRFTKWAHYFDIYEEHFSGLLKRRQARGVQGPLRVLEIGVWPGGSLELWRNYFGEEAVIFGVEINPEHLQLSDDVAQVRIGSQSDPSFLEKVVDEMGGVDIVIDDGSHIADDVLSSLRTLFPKLSSPGIYIIEDLHTSYWKHWGGGFLRKGSAIEVSKELIDLLHAPYNRQIRTPHWLGISRDELRGAHFYDSILVLEKDRMTYPAKIHAG